MNRQTRRAARVACLLTLVGVPSFAHAELLWTGTSAGTGRFYDGLAWSGGIAPVGTDNVRFPAGASLVTLDNELGVPTVTDLSLNASAALSIAQSTGMFIYDPTLYFSGAISAGAGSTLTIKNAGLVYAGSSAFTLPSTLSTTIGEDNVLESDASIFLESASSLTIAGSVNIAFGALSGTDVVVASTGSVRARRSLLSTTRFDVFGTIDAQNDAGVSSAIGGTFKPGSSLLFDGGGVESGYFAIDYSDPNALPLKFEAGSNVYFDIVGSGGFETDNDYFYVEGSLDIDPGALFHLDFAGGFVPEVNDEFILAEAEQALLMPASSLVPIITGLPPQLSAEIVFDEDANRVLARIIAIPEPASLAVMGLAAAIFLRRR
jgi:PEP-CTERM motif